MREVKIVGIILAIDVMFVGCNTLIKATKEMSNYIFITYTHAISVLFLIPVAFLYHRKKPPPPIGCSTILRTILLAIISYGCSFFFFNGIRYSSPTLGSAINNLCLPFTFILAIIVRMENLNLREKSCILKLIGTVVSISGAFIMIFYQGLPITVFPSPTKPSFQSLVQLQTQPSDWVVGGIFLFISSLNGSLMCVTKTWIVRDFPSEVLITLITFFFETIVAAIVTLIAENDASVWTPSTGIALISILCGAVTLSTIYIFNTWACKVKGPVFIAMFQPLQMIIAVIMGVSFFGDVLHLGSVIGGMIIALGFYTMIKGTAEEDMSKNDDANKLTYNIEEESRLLKSPLLHDKIMDA